LIAKRGLLKCVAAFAGGFIAMLLYGITYYVRDGAIMDCFLKLITLQWSMKKGV